MVHDRGFTLVETLLGVVILALGAAVVVGVSQRCLRHTVRGMEYEQGWYLLDEVMDKSAFSSPAQAVGKVQVGDFGSRYPDYRYEIKVASAGQERLYKVTGVVKWDVQSQLYEVQAETLVYDDRAVEVRDAVVPGGMQWFPQRRLQSGKKGQVMNLDKSKAGLSRLGEVFADKKHLLVVLQDNPDPDSLAAAVALRELGRHLADVDCVLGHGGTVGRAENRALVRYLGLNLRQIKELDLLQFDVVGMVDTQPGTGNNSWPADAALDIVFDHHSFNPQTEQAGFHDIRKEYGAATTILWEYMQAASLEPDTPLATGMIYAIRSDTQDLGREARQADIIAIQNLYPLANLRMLSEIQRGRVTREYYVMLAAGLSSAEFYGDSVVAFLGDITVPDMIGEVADLLLRDEQAAWSLCMGVFDAKLLLSLRTVHNNQSAEKVMKKLVARRGTGGGHQRMAGGQIPLTEGMTEKDLRKLLRMLREKYLHLTDAEGQEAVKLVPVSTTDIERE